MQVSELVKALQYIEKTYGDGKVVLAFDVRAGKGLSGPAVDQDENIFTSSVGMPNGTFELHIQNFPF